MPFWQLTTISLGFLKINTWYLFLVLAFLVFFVWFSRLSSSPFCKGGLRGIFSAAFLISLLGARFFNQLGGSWSLSDFFNLQKGGLSFFGGLFSVLLFFFILSRTGKIDFFRKKYLNLAAAPLALSLAVGRIGCFLINDHPGTLTNLPWGIVWPNGETRHPVALYLIVAY